MYNKCTENFNNVVIIYFFFPNVKVIMDICAIICEFNPFHNGHKHLIEEARRLSGCQAVLCIMSGSFTQRGEPTILSKFDRARHAVENGADAIIELPTRYAVAPAEIFAFGAISILSKIPSVKVLAFGAETPDAKVFEDSANLLLDESEQFKNSLADGLNDNLGYIRSYCNAFASCGGNPSVLENPNNVLGIEYTKAIKRLNSSIKILPIKRIGNGYNDDNLAKNFSSASAIRNNANNPFVKNNVPKEVFDSLDNCYIAHDNFKEACALKALQSDGKILLETYGCNEELKNKIKSVAKLGYDAIIDEASGKNYSRSRIKRILCATLLNLKANNATNCISRTLFIKPLAIKKQLKNSILSCLAQSNLPIVIRNNDVASLDDGALSVFNEIVNADDVWSLLSGKEIYNFTTVLV